MQTECGKNRGVENRRGRDLRGRNLRGRDLRGRNLRGRNQRAQIAAVTNVNSPFCRAMTLLLRARFPIGPSGTANGPFVVSR
ncbi:hypothetical protein DLJ54_03335 [Corynebacterium heidelbergense]|uniref:Pentapeptide repeat-containing protein n=1 Tax=Corynebacterium heidelbergense TaxID=2055947 RepID=A0A364V739_9CORY|nr:hypothetical protein DLJ54_03335 [Corynebacterium heidelbergense]